MKVIDFQWLSVGTELVFTYDGSDPAGVTNVGFLSIDSHNTNPTNSYPMGYTVPDLPDKQNLSLPGKVIALDTSDANEDGIPGYADGYHLDGLPDDLTNDSNFVKMTVTLPGGFDPVNGQIELSYQCLRSGASLGNGRREQRQSFRVPASQRRRRPADLVESHYESWFFEFYHAHGGALRRSRSERSQ